MTKKIRIENADTSNHNVKVTVQRKNAAGQWEDVPAEAVDINTPTQLTEKYVHSHQRLIVEEVAAAS
jgi:hypothetical protein